MHVYWQLYREWHDKNSSKTSAKTLADCITIPTDAGLPQYEKRKPIENVWENQGISWMVMEMWKGLEKFGILKTNGNTSEKIVLIDGK